MSAALAPVEARPGPAAPGKGKRREGSPHVVQAATRPKCGPVIERLAVLRSGITSPHIIAVLRLRADWAIGGGNAPRVQAALRAVGWAATPLLLWVVIHDRPISGTNGWCALPMNRRDGAPDPKKELGRLLASLDMLAAHYEPAPAAVWGALATAGA